MKLLSLSFDHVKLFENGTVSIDFFASDKVPAGDESTTPLEKPLYINNVIAFAGINASGKTTILRLVAFALAIIQRGVSARPPAADGIEDLFDAPPRMRAVLWDAGEVFVLDSLLTYPALPLGSKRRSSFAFEEEALYRLTGTLTKSLLRQGASTLIDRSEEVMRRSTLDDASKRFLVNDVSIMASRTGSLAYAYHAAGDSPLPASDSLIGATDILQAFDADIEFLNPLEESDLFELKFKRDEDTLLLSQKELERTLSSGTLRGFSLVESAVFALMTGGYLLLDEIENHLNKQLVQVIIDLFARKDSNPYGAVLVFTTHYPEILDSVHRKDCVYFLAHGADDKTSLVKYSDRVNRIENKKSEVFLSNYVKGTAPRFSEVAALRAHVKSAVESIHHE